MPNTRDIQRRIKSVASIKKITKAMELVATSKMKRAVEAVLATRPYANLSWVTVLRLANGANGDLHPLLKKTYQRDTKKIGLVMITSNRGLCGGYNAQILNRVMESVKKYEQAGKKTEFFLLGKQGRNIIAKHKQLVVADFEKMDFLSDSGEVRPLAKMIIKDFLKKKYDKIFVAYTDFISTIKQAPRIKQLLPIQIDKKDESLGIMGKDSRLKIDEGFVKEKEDKYLKDEQGHRFEYLFEPSPREILDEMLPRLIEIQLYQAMLEANASEQSARMMAMKNATDAAGDMIEELSLAYNKARQAGITQEIAEISAGANALK